MFSKLKYKDKKMFKNLWNDMKKEMVANKMIMMT